MIPVELPDEVKALPIMDVKEDLDLDSCYMVVGSTLCRRCLGKIDDPDGSYPCLLCKGKGEENLPGSRRLVCNTHRDQELVNIGRRYVTWEMMGFDHTGWLAVKGCPICKLPLLSKMWY